MKREFIDGAKVIKLSKRGLYGNVDFKSEMKVVKIEYIAICQYENDDDYYLFACDANFNVLGDSVYDNYENAKKAAKINYEADLY